MSGGKVLWARVSPTTKNDFVSNHHHFSTLKIYKDMNNLGITIRTIQITPGMREEYGTLQG